MTADKSVTKNYRKNDKRVIKSRKHYLLLDDGEQDVVELVHENGSVVRFTNDEIVLRDKQGNRLVIASKSGAMTLEAKGQLNIRAATITIEATGTLDLKASTPPVTAPRLVPDQAARRSGSAVSPLGVPSPTCMPARSRTG